MNCKKYIILLVLIFNASLLFSQENNENYLTGVANIYYKDYYSAIKNFTSAIQTNPDNSEYYPQRAEAYFLNGQYENAISDLLVAEEKDNGSGSLLLARCYSKLGNNQKASEWLIKHLESEYKLPKAKIKLDQDLEGLEKTGYWQEIWKTEWYTDHENKVSEIEYQIKKENYDDAFEGIISLMAENPDDAGAYYLRSRIHYSQNNLSKAVSDLSKAIELDPGEDIYITERARVLTKQKKYKKALVDYNKGIEKNGTDLNLYYERGIVRYRSKDYDKALEDLNFYTKYYYQDEKALAICGGIYFNTGNYTNAIENYTTLLILDPSKSEYYIARGDSYLDSGAYSDAEKDYTQVLDLNANTTVAYINRGIARHATGDAKGACYDWNKAKRLGHPEAGYYLSKHCR